MTKKAWLMLLGRSQSSKRAVMKCTIIAIEIKLPQEYFYYPVTNKTTVRHHFTPTRMAIMKKSTNNKCWRGCGEKGTLLHCWWECKLVEPLWRTVWRFLRKLKIELPYDPAIPLLAYIWRKP